MQTVALPVTALLFGGMVLYAFGFAAFLFSALPAETAGPTIRKAFPKFYGFVIGTAALAGTLLWFQDPLGAGLLGLVAVSTVPTRQRLMPAINHATDTGNRRRFHGLHGLSVAITLSQIAVVAFVLARFIAAATP